jgi:hypothetical protein
MEGGDEDMESDVTTQQDDELIRMESDQFMEDQNEPSFEQTMQTNLDRLTRDYGKMEAISVQWEKNLLEIENTYLQ